MKMVLADQSMNVELCALMRENSMSGAIEMVLAREGDFFNGQSVQGEKSETIAAVDENRIVGMACRCRKSLYMDGRETEVGYLSGLRISEAYRKSTVLARCFQSLRQADSERWTVPFYLTTIIDDNHQAKKSLTSGKAGAPKYTDIGGYNSHLVFFNRYRSRSRVRDLRRLKKGGEIGLEKIVAFLNREGRKKQFFPALRPEVFSSDYTRDFKLDDFYVLMDGQEILGVVGKWDQSRFKQPIVRRYRGLTKLTKPIINPLLKLSGYAGFPAAGAPVPMFYLSFICARDNDPELLRVLVNKLHDDYKGSQYRCFAVGLFERDDLNQAIKGYAKYVYKSRAYAVNVDADGNSGYRIESSRVPYLELATL